MTSFDQWQFLWNEVVGVFVSNQVFCKISSSISINVQWPLVALRCSSSLLTNPHLQFEFSPWEHSNEAANYMTHWVTELSYMHVFISETHMTMCDTTYVVLSDNRISDFF